MAENYKVEENLHGHLIKSDRSPFQKKVADFMRTDWHLLINDLKGTQRRTSSGYGSLTSSVTTGEMWIYRPRVKLTQPADNNDNNGNHTQSSDPV